MNLLITITALLFGSITLNAQSIKGCIIDGTNQPVDYATVVLQTPDSIYVNSAMTDSLGCFNISTDLTEFRLIVQHLLYDTKEITSTNQHIGSIVLHEKEHTLNEVVVKGERPAVSVIDGRLTYDMPRLLEGKVVSNAYESILELPGIREQDGNLILAGANSVTVILNGKPTSMTSAQLLELLKNTPKENIEKAEIMYSAPPQYHVRGAAINLVLKGKYTNQPQLQGQINSSYTQRSRERYSLGAILLYTSSKFSTDFLYTFTEGRHKSRLDLYSLHTYNGVVNNIEQHNIDTGHSQNHNIRFGTEYSINENNKINLTYTSAITPTTGRTSKSEGTFSNSENRKKQDKPEQMHNVALSYSSGFGLEVGVDYTYFTDNTLQDFTDQQSGIKRSFTSKSSQEINRMKIYADQSHSLGKGWNLNYGGEYSFATDRSKQIYDDRLGGNLSDKNTDNQLNERTYNFYTGFEKSITEKFSLSASLAGEYYRHGDFDEWSIFPTLEATYTLSPSNIIQLSVSTDKEYPSYWEMLESVAYLNGYTELHGNPSLRPSKDYSIQLNYILKGKYVFSIYGNYIDDYSVQLPYQASDRLALIYKTTNFDYKQTLGMSVVAPAKITEWLNSRLTVNVFQDKVKSSHFHDISFEKKKWTLYSSLNNTIKISTKPDIKAEADITYATPFIQGPGTLSPLWTINSGVKWTFADGNAELRLKANNIFDTWNPNMRLKYATQDINMKVRDDSRSLTVSFVYKFGGFKNKEHKTVDTSRFGQ